MDNDEEACFLNVKVPLLIVDGGERNIRCWFGKGMGFKKLCQENNKNT